jgi:hypothetical protein
VKKCLLRTSIICLLMSAGSLTLVGCTSDKPPVTVAAAATTTSIPAGTKLTVGQATKLSRLFFVNRDKGGADVNVQVPYGIGSSITIIGQVDWKKHVGRAEIRVVTDDGKVVDTSKVWWGNVQDPQRGFVVSSLKGLTKEMETAGRSGVNYVARPFSDKSPVDLILRYLDALSAEQPENPLLLRQDKKTGYLGAEQLELVGQGKTVTDPPTKTTVSTDIIRFGRSRYWIDTKTSELVQVAAPLAGLRSPTVYSFTNRGEKTIVFPQNAEVVDAADIPEIYAQLTSRPK